ncbi:arsenite methyltransferase-like [Stigmatopora nigra]
MADKTSSQDTDVHLGVKDYYGKILQKTSDINSNACSAQVGPLPKYILQALKKVHPDVTDRYYGCGSTMPECLEGCKILDLGCGSGRDCYTLSQLVGEAGHITGIDMTEDQLEVARKHVDFHMKEFGYKNPNVTFVHGYIEALSEAALEKNSFDIIISNCVVNLSPDKRKVLTEAYCVLKDGGEFFFSDMYCNGRQTDEIKNNKLLWGEGFGGALWYKDLLQLAEEVGFRPPRLVKANVITVHNKGIQAILGDFKFVSATYRLFKVPKSTPNPCKLIYNGKITGAEDNLLFDCQYNFKTDQVVEVDGELADILTHSRFSQAFTFLPQGGSCDPCAIKPKAVSVDPFELALQLQKQSVGSATGGCCSTQSATCCN